jgi:hypothetical protein
LIRSNYWQVGGGAAYSLGPVDIFGSVLKYVWGRDAHNGQAYNVGMTWYFDVGKDDLIFSRRGHDKPRTHLARR